MKQSDHIGIVLVLLSMITFCVIIMAKYSIGDNYEFRGDRQHSNSMLNK